MCSSAIALCPSTIALCCSTSVLCLSKVVPWCRKVALFLSKVGLWYRTSGLCFSTLAYAKLHKTIVFFVRPIVFYLFTSFSVMLAVVLSIMALVLQIIPEILPESLVLRFKNRGARPELTEWLFLIGVFLLKRGAVFARPFMSGSNLARLLSRKRDERPRECQDLVLRLADFRVSVRLPATGASPRLRRWRDLATRG